MANEDERFVPDGPNPGREKYCHKCEKWKPLSEYFKRGKDSKYYHGYCKDCHKSPFQYDRIICPHCKNKIMFFGLDVHNKIVKQKSDFVKRLTREIKQETTSKKKGKEPRVKTDKALKDLLGDNE